jgi:hypothetical protein
MEVPMLRRVQELLNSTSEFKVPPTTNGNGQVRNGGNGHHRRVRHQIHHNHRRAALKADTAVMLAEDGMAVIEAIERCGTNPAYFYALRALKESGDTALYNAVLKGNAPILTSGKRVENAAVVIAAYAKCSELEKGLIRIATGLTADLPTMLWRATPDQLVAASKALGLDWVWDRMIAAAMETERTIAETPVEVLEAAE